MLESPFNKKRLHHCCSSVKFAKVLRIPILKNDCERLLLFVLSQNTIVNSNGEFGLDEISTECKESISLNLTILFGQMLSPAIDDKMSSVISILLLCHLYFI